MFISMLILNQWACLDVVLIVQYHYYRITELAMSSLQDSSFTDLVVIASVPNMERFQIISRYKGLEIIILTDIYTWSCMFFISMFLSIELTSEALLCSM